MSGKILKGSAEEAHRFGESTFMIYTGAPQNTRKSINDLNIEKSHKVMEQYGLSICCITLYNKYRKYNED